MIYIYINIKRDRDIEIRHSNYIEYLKGLALKKLQ